MTETVDAFNSTSQRNAESCK